MLARVGVGVAVVPDVVLKAHRPQLPLPLVGAGGILGVAGALADLVILHLVVLSVNVSVALESVHHVWREVLEVDNTSALWHDRVGKVSEGEITDSKGANVDSVGLDTVGEKFHLAKGGKGTAKTMADDLHLVVWILSLESSHLSVNIVIYRVNTSVDTVVDAAIALWPGLVIGDERLFEVHLLIWLGVSASEDHIDSLLGGHVPDESRDIITLPPNSLGVLEVLHKTGPWHVAELAHGAVHLGAQLPGDFSLLVSVPVLGRDWWRTWDRTD